MPTIIDDDRVELEFRDGTRYVAKYLALAMDHIETYRYSYRDAVDEANKRMSNDVVERAFDRVIDQHFRGNR